MAVAINLVPDQKQTQVQDTRKKQLIFTLLVTINGGLIGLIVVLFFVTQAQHFAIDRVQSGINSKQAQLVQTENLQDMLTLQQNLKALPGLYKNRTLLTKFFAVLEKVSPNSVFVTALSAGEGGLLEVTGTAPNYRLVSKLAAAMEANGDFSGVSINSANGENGTVSFTINAAASPQATAVGGQ